MGGHNFIAVSQQRCGQRGMKPLISEFPPWRATGPLAAALAARQVAKHVFGGIAASGSAIKLCACSNYILCTRVTCSHVTTSDFNTYKLVQLAEAAAYARL